MSENECKSWPYTKSGVVKAARGNTLRTAAKGERSWRGLGLFWPAGWGALHPQGGGNLDSDLLAYLKCEREPAVCIYISRRRSCLGGHFWQANHLGVWHQHFWWHYWCWHFWFLQNTFSQRASVSGAIIEVGCEEVLRKNSHCVSEELMLIFCEWDFEKIRTGSSFP